jgi:protein involved in polysaccharide export with SLBB domain
MPRRKRRMLRAMVLTPIKAVKMWRIRSRASDDRSRVMRKTQAYYFSIVLCVFFVSSLVFSQGPPPVTDDNPGNSEMNRIHFGDLIDVDVVGSFEFDWRGSINPEGFLSGFNKIPEPVLGICRSEKELADEIAKEYGKFLREPKIVVKILDRTNRPVSILQGAVRTPHRFQITRDVNLNELLILAGGLSDKANGEISIFRPKNLNCQGEVEKGSLAAASNGETREKFIMASRGNDSETLNIRIIDLLSGDKQANPQILSGDIITVSEAAPIYVIGGVNSPKQIAARVQFTLSRAVASAGGLAKEGLDKVTIFRRTGNDRKAIEADLKRIGDGQDPDPLLEPFDIVDVGQKGRERRKVPPAIDDNSVDGARPLIFPLRVIE